MAVKVCDVLMGGGKTSAAINYINAHPEKKFLYVSMYLPEAARIKAGCPDAHFAEPQKMFESQWSKSQHVLELVKEGKNIASTQQAMAFFSHETLEMIRDKNYTVIIDEEIEVLQQAVKTTKADIDVAVKAGLIEQTGDGTYRRTCESYGGGAYSELLKMMELRPLVDLTNKRGRNTGKIYYWIYPKDVFFYAREVIVLTYLFQGSEMQSVFKFWGVEYQNIGVSKKNGDYQFVDHPMPPPEYARHLKEKIHIDSGERINAIGKNKNALSMTWYTSQSSKTVPQMKKNLFNYFNHRVDISNKNNRMCGTYKSNWGKIRDKGYWNSDVTFNKKATNEYRDKQVLAYPVNIFANVGIVLYYDKLGVPIDQDRYALATMIQWIWRSAIRDGKDIWIYLPSKRMRDLLINWMDTLVQDSDTLVDDSDTLVDDSDTLVDDSDTLVENVACLEEMNTHERLSLEACRVRREDLPEMAEEIA